MIIAEIGQAHDGSLGTAHAYIDAVSKAGADAIKFQTHIANAESSPLEPWRVKFSLQDASRYDYWKRMEFNKNEWQGLKTHVKKLGLKFLSSAFSIEAFELLNDIGVDAWKVASGEINNIFLLEKMIKTSLPIYLSTGMSSYEEIDEAVKMIKSNGNDLCIFQCTSMYPTPSQKWGLNVISEFKKRYECQVGFSDHSGNIYSGLSAVSFGADILEVHVVFDKGLFGPDVKASLTFKDLKKLIEGKMEIENAIKNPVNKDEIRKELNNTKVLFDKSLFSKYSIKKGDKISSENTLFKKPGTGILIDQWNEVKNKTAKKSINSGEIILISDLSDK